MSTPLWAKEHSCTGISENDRLCTGISENDRSCTVISEHDRSCTGIHSLKSLTDFFNKIVFCRFLRNFNVLNSA